MRVRRMVVVVASLVWLCGASVGTQQQTGEVFGRTVDASGAAVAGVTVTVPGPALITPRFGITSDSGTYRIPELPIGIYTVSFELTGFRTVSRPDVRVTIGFRALVNATMEVSPILEALTVAAESPLL